MCRESLIAPSIFAVIVVRSLGYCGRDLLAVSLSALTMR
jgi:hypothetical protein